MPSRSFDALESQVGETNRTVEGFTVESGKVAEFARAIHDADAIYLDEHAALDAGYDGIPAPPTFTRVSFFPHFRPSGIDESFGFNLEFDREYVLHGEQRYRYERPVLVGETLWAETTLTNVFQRPGQSGGTMTFAVFRTDFYDEGDELVQQAWNTRIETDGPPTEIQKTTPTGSHDAAATSDGEPGFDVGDVGPEVKINDLERRDFVVYAGSSGDFNPIHYDEPYATQAGHPSVFGQGMFGAGIASGLLQRWVGLDALSTFRTQFTARIFPGDALEAQGRVVDSTPIDGGRDVEIEFELVAPSSERQVLEGDASATVENTE